MKPTSHCKKPLVQQFGKKSLGDEWCGEIYWNHYTAHGNESDSATVAIPPHTKQRSTVWPALPFLSKLPKSWTDVHKTCTWIFTALPFIIVQKQKQHQCPSTDEYTQNVVYPYNGIIQL